MRLDRVLPTIERGQRALHTASLLILCAMTMGSAALADIEVFHSPLNDGVNPGTTPEIPFGSVWELNLYIESNGAPSSTGVVCEDADGSEVCAVDLVILPYYGIQLSSFTPAAGVVYDLSSSRIRLNQIEPISGITSSVWLGTLEIDATSALAGWVFLEAGTALDAGLHSVFIAPKTLAQVPEPTVASALACGMLLLGGLDRRRRLGRSRKSHSLLRGATRGSPFRPSRAPSRIPTTGVSAIILVLVLHLSSPAAAGIDRDGVPDVLDNCPMDWNAAQLDRDGDGIGDVCDNCRFSANPGQEDPAGFDSDLPDGWGTACQCGDYDDTGRTDLRDAVVLARYLAGAGAEGATNRCPTEAGGLCDAAALLAMRQALVDGLPLAPTCQAATCSTTATFCAGGACPENPIVVENRRTGSPRSEWDIVTTAEPDNVASDQNLTGYTDDISYAPGETVDFMIKANVPYELDIYRVGYYGGTGARLVRSTSHPTAEVQTDCSVPVDAPPQGTAREPVICNWNITDSWAIPNGQVSGVYLAKVSPSPGAGSSSPGSHILFVIRDDVGGSDILFQTADSTWQAYNPYLDDTPGDNTDNPGTTFYNGGVRVSYDRPLQVKGAGRRRGFFGAQYQLVRFLERNGYDVSYSASVDAARRGSEIAEHAVFLSSGHDEYWSREMRDAVTAARDAGTHLVFLSGNLMFWKTRWEYNFRTQVSYKSTQHLHDGALLALDDQGGFTGTWRDVRFQDLGDLAEPENAVTGLLFGSNDTLCGSCARLGFHPIRVPADEGQMRIWRDTPAASSSIGDVVELAPYTVGWEVDTDQDNGYRPPGLIHLSTTSFSRAQTMYGAGPFAAGGTFTNRTSPLTHHTSLYRHPSGALVFNAGTIWWSLGLGRTSLADIYGGILDLTMTQATANVLQDMGVVGATPLDVCPSTLSADTMPPSSTITSHAAISTERIGEAIRLAGTATDIGGEVGGVEVSVDGGATWHPATGRESWHYDWRPANHGPQTVLSRAVDDSGNLETAPTSQTIDLACDGGLCSVWPPTDPSGVLHSPITDPLEVGMRFRADVAGRIYGIRYWASATNPGPHDVHLWGDNGFLLAQATGSASAVDGWRTVLFPLPIVIQPNTTYTASYNATDGFDSTSSALTNSQYRKPLRVFGGGGVYAWGSSPTFPSTQSNALRNFWVDVLFEPTGAGTRSLFQPAPVPAELDHYDASVADDDWGVEVGVEFHSAVDGIVKAIRFYRPDDSTSQIVNLWRDIRETPPPGIAFFGDTVGSPIDGLGVILSSGKTFAGTGTGWHFVPLDPPVPIRAGETYVASYHVPRESARYAVNRNYFTTPVSDPPLTAVNSRYRYGKTAYPELTYQDSNYWVDVEFEPTAPTVHSFWPDDASPSMPHRPDTEIEVGLRFIPEADGVIEGIRFFKHPANNGTHVGTLWTDTEIELAQTTFTAETASGWQTQLFAQPVPVEAGTTYVASYHTTTGYALDQDPSQDQFPIWAPPLYAPYISGSAENGLYKHGPRAFPVNSIEGSNYWVDVLFRSAAVPAEHGPTEAPYHPLP